MPKKHSPHTLDAYRRDLATISLELAAVLGKESEVITIDDLDVKALRLAFAAISDRSAATVSRMWSTWNQLFTFLVADQVLPGNPMAAVEKPKLPKSRPKAITGDESVERLLTVAAKGRARARNPWPERDLAIVVTLLTCGLRLSELLNLRIDSIDGPEGDRILGVKGKGNKERTVPVEPEVESILVDYLESRMRRFPGRLDFQTSLFVDGKGEPMKRGGLQYLVESLYREAGIRSNVPAGALVHALRHTFATSLARNGAGGVELQRLLGHESLATTQRYIDATAREIRLAARANDAYRVIRAMEEPNGR